MIPDDAVVIIVEHETRVESIERPQGVVMIATRGPAGAFEPSAVAHFYDKENPHEGALLDVVIPPGHNGRWMKIVDGKIAETEEEPLYPEDIRPPETHDERVRVDSETPSSNLAQSVRFPLVVYYGSNEGEHRLRLKNDRSPAKRRFYGTDVTGTVGFNLIQGKKVIL